MNKEKQLTAVEFLLSKTAKHCFNKDEIEKAKAMEKQRMIDFAKYCLNNAKYLNFEKALFNVEEYYEIFKSE